MNKTKTAKQDRIEIRVDKDTKKLLEKAAQLLGESTSSYILGHSLRAALQDIEKHETLVLSGKDKELFYSLITHPPEPNKNLVDLMNNHPQQ